MPLYNKCKSCHYKLWYNFILQSFNIDFVLYKIKIFLYKMNGRKWFCSFGGNDLRDLRETICKKTYR